MLIIATIRHTQEFIEYDEGEVFPYLLVSCGSGVSILRVDDDDKFERVSGSAIGGGRVLFYVHTHY